jgi:hypothetical protein
MSSGAYPADRGFKSSLDIEGMASSQVERENSGRLFRDAAFVESTPNVQRKWEIACYPNIPRQPPHQV